MHRMGFYQVLPYSDATICCIISDVALQPVVGRSREVFRTSQVYSA